MPPHWSAGLTAPLADASRHLRVVAGLPPTRPGVRHHATGAIFSHMARPPSRAKHRFRWHRGHEDPNKMEWASFPAQTPHSSMVAVLSAAVTSKDPGLRVVGLMIPTWQLQRSRQEAPLTLTVAPYSSLPECGGKRVFSPSPKMAGKNKSSAKPAPHPYPSGWQRVQHPLIMSVG